MADIMVKPAASLVDKYTSGAKNRAGLFVANVAATTKDQAALAVAKKAVLFQVLADPATQNRWAAHLTAAGTAKWKAKIALVGQTRYSQGIDAGAPLWAAHVQPFFDMLSSLPLPAFTFKGDPGNAQRSTAVQQALHAKKVSG